jgi:glycosyltransferase involved in cell wall biosynthesis
MRKITVILCTYNRSQSLAKALESVAASEVPASIEWEVQVVDNNSKDQTRSVVESFCDKYPNRFRYIFEEKQGKSNALNTGITQARGDVLAFMDDDVLVAPTWLQNLTAPLLQGGWSGAGGRILSQELLMPPRWLALEGPYSVAGMLALFDLGDKGRMLDCPPFGTNMAFLKSVFERHGDFRIDMGPCPGSEIRNEDTEFGRRVMAAGERIWYEPSAVVYHAVPEERLTKQYLLRFWFDHGRASMREAEKKPNVWMIPRWWLTVPKIALTVLPLRTFNWLFALDPKRRFFFKGFVWMTLGQMKEIYNLSTRTSTHLTKADWISRSN